MEKYSAIKKVWTAADIFHNMNDLQKYFANLKEARFKIRYDPIYIIS